MHVRALCYLNPALTEAPSACTTSLHFNLTYLPSPTSPSADLQAMSASERRTELQLAGLDELQIESVALYLSAQPRLNIAVRVEADEGDSDVQQGDIGHCRVSVLVSARWELAWLAAVTAAARVVARAAAMLCVIVPTVIHPGCQVLGYHPACCPLQKRRLY
jgi:hypothetical protein